MKKSDFLLVFSLDEQRYAIPLSAADRVVRMVAITPLPKGPDIVLGIVNFQGCVVPVIDMRRRFRLQVREIALSDQLVVAHTARRPVALVVDMALDVIPCPVQSLIAAEDILPNVEYVGGVVKLADGLILIYDLDEFLSLEEEKSLDRALETS